MYLLRIVVLISSIYKYNIINQYIIKYVLEGHFCFVILVLLLSYTSICIYIYSLSHLKLFKFRVINKNANGF